MEIVLTGTYVEILHLITTNNSELKGTKRQPTPFANTWTQNIKKMKKSPLKVTCKSRGRVYGLPQSTKINNKSANVKLEQKWKVDLRKCIDSSPLLLFSENQSLIVSCSHAGRVVDGIVWNGMGFDCLRIIQFRSFLCVSKTSFYILTRHTYMINTCPNPRCHCSS